MLSCCYLCRRSWSKHERPHLMTSSVPYLHPPIEHGKHDQRQHRELRGTTFGIGVSGHQSMMADQTLRCCRLPYDGSIAGFSTRYVIITDQTLTATHQSHVFMKVIETHTHLYDTQLFLLILFISAQAALFSKRYEKERVSEKIRIVSNKIRVNPHSLLISSLIHMKNLRRPFR